MGGLPYVIPCEEPKGDYNPKSGGAPMGGNDPESELSVVLDDYVE